MYYIGPKTQSIFVSEGSYKYESQGIIESIK